jgi:hypothetical protein
MLYRKLGQALTTLQSENERLTVERDGHRAVLAITSSAVENQLRAHVADLGNERDALFNENAGLAATIAQLQSQLRVLEARCEAADSMATAILKIVRHTTRCQEFGLYSDTDCLCHANLVYSALDAYRATSNPATGEHNGGD